MNFPSPFDHVLPDNIPCHSPPLSSPDIVTLDRVIGSLTGLAVGDALGASVEFQPRHYLAAHPVYDMQSGGTWGLRAGQWTDDTSMALCLASSLITQHGFNPYDQMVRYKWWYKYGFLSSTGHCFDIGNTTRQSLDEFSRRQNILMRYYAIRDEQEVDTLPLYSVQRVREFSWYCSTDGAGNGALMRLAPVPLFYYRVPNKAVALAGESARPTHGDQRAIDACRYYAALIVAAIHGESKNELLSNNFYITHQNWFGTSPLHEEVLRVAKGSYKRPRGYEDGIRGSGYVIQALEAALWAFWADGGTFNRGALLAVNLGDDTDTTAAIYGQLAGAFYGYRAISTAWLRQLYAGHLIACVGRWLHFEGSRSSRVAGIQMRSRALRRAVPW